ncbi:MAG: COP23 domain-containing protein [Cyanobacteria bacterium SBLK]|nr:COP23 domain-containing protein [Cyanobacteria bacterium SBLK]
MSNSTSILKGIGFSLATLAFLGGNNAPAFSSVVAESSEVPHWQIAQLDSEETNSKEEETAAEDAPETEAETAGTDNAPRFTCATHEGVPTVMYSPKEQETAYPWAVPQTLGGGWTPQKRCEAIAQRLEQYRPDGMVELQNSTENNYDVVCVTTEKDPACRIVLTVPPGQSPEIVRDRVFENLTLADSGESTQGVATFTDGGSPNEILGQLGQLGNIFNTGSSSPNGNIRLSSPGAINLKPFLAPSDGGTGSGLNRLSGDRHRGLQLNPDRFR